MEEGSYADNDGSDNGDGDDGGVIIVMEEDRIASVVNLNPWEAGDGASDDTEVLANTISSNVNNQPTSPSPSPSPPPSALPRPSPHGSGTGTSTINTLANSININNQPVLDPYDTTACAESDDDELYVVGLFIHSSSSFTGLCCHKAAGGMMLCWC
jgi:hypothetical protein